MSLLQIAVLEGVCGMDRTTADEVSGAAASHGPPRLAAEERRDSSPGLWSSSDGGCLKSLDHCFVGLSDEQIAQRVAEMGD